MTRSGGRSLSGGALRRDSQPFTTRRYAPSPMINNTMMHWQNKKTRPCTPAASTEEIDIHSQQRNRRRGRNRECKPRKGVERLAGPNPDFGMLEFAAGRTSGDVTVWAAHQALWTRVVGTLEQRYARNTPFHALTEMDHSTRSPCRSRCNTRRATGLKPCSSMAFQTCLRVVVQLKTDLKCVGFLAHADTIQDGTADDYAEPTCHAMPCAVCGSADFRQQWSLSKANLAIPLIVTCREQI